MSEDEKKIVESRMPAEPEKKEDDAGEDEYMAMLKEGEKETAAKKAKEAPEPTDDEPDKITIMSAEPKKKKKKKEEEEVILTEESKEPKIYALRTTANREDQVMSFVSSNAGRKKLEVYSVVRPHGMRGYIFIEAGTRADAEQAAFGVPYARGLLPNIIQYKEIEHMLEQVKKEMNIQKNDIAEIISGPFKREKCKITRIDKAKEEVVVELLEAAVPIPLTLKMDAVKVIRRDEEAAKAGADD
jgi:transcription termination/antitermination protein NusG